MRFLSLQPVWLCSTIYILGFAAYAIGGLICTQWLRKSRGIAFQNELTSYFFGAVALLYGVILGLTTISVWTNYADTDKAVASEAASIWIMFRSADVLDDRYRIELQDLLRSYVHETVTMEWPRLRRGESGDDYSPVIEALQRRIESQHPEDGAQQSQEDLHTELRDLVYARQGRLSTANVELPRCMWVLVMLGAGVTLTSGFFFQAESMRLHMLLLTLLASLLATTISLIAVLDLPLLGQSGITPAPLERVGQDMEDHLRKHQVRVQTGTDRQSSHTSMPPAASPFW